MRLFTLLSFIGSLACASVAHASDTFPAFIADELQALREPSCSVCHSGGTTGRGTVGTPFGKAMRERGLTARNQESLRVALEAIEAAQLDSDADEISDVDELIEGTDPNLRAGQAPPTPIRYGCVQSVAGYKGSTLRGVWPLLLAFLALRASRRMRAKERPALGIRSRDSPTM